MKKYIYIFIVHKWYQGEHHFTEVDMGIINEDCDNNLFGEQRQSYSNQLYSQQYQYLETEGQSTHHQVDLFFFFLTAKINTLQ